MIRQVTTSLGALSVTNHISTAVSFWRSRSDRTSSEGEGSGDNLKEAKTWLNSLDSKTVPSSIWSVRQNKSDPKITIVASVASINNYVPKLLHEGVKGYRYCKKGSSEIVISTQARRKRTDNERECMQKFDRMLREVADEEIEKEQNKEHKRLTTASMHLKSGGITPQNSHRRKIPYQVYSKWDRKTYLKYYREHSAKAIAKAKAKEKQEAVFQARQSKKWGGKEQEKERGN